MPLTLTERDVRDLVTTKDAIEALEEAHKHQGAGDAVNEARRRLRAPHGSVAVMFGGDAGTGFLGFKTAFYAGGAVHVLLYDMNARSLAAVIQAGLLGAIRTGAASGVATRHMAREDSATAGIIGTGQQARTQLEAVCAVRPVTRAFAYGRDAARRAEFASRMTDRVGVPVTPVDDPREAARADIVTTATNSATPVLHGDWLTEGAHVNAIGSNSLLRREIDQDTVRRAGRIVVDDREQVALESGDLMEAFERGLIDRARLPELGDVVAGRAPGRVSADEITLFESHGIGLWDVALATMVYLRAREQGRGVEVDI